MDRLLRDRCAASLVIAAEDLLHDVSSPPAMDSERRGTTVVLLHAPTGVSVRAGYELPSGRPAAEYREAITRAIGEASDRLEAEVSRAPVS